jgi:hypothetical protein
MHQRIKEIVEEFSNVPHDMMCARMQEYLQDDVFKGFAAFREHVHVREHAMVALLPLLQHLSASDSKKLVYAASSTAIWRKRMIFGRAFVAIISESSHSPMGTFHVGLPSLTKISLLILFGGSNKMPVV